MLRASTPRALKWQIETVAHTYMSQLSAMDSWNHCLRKQFQKAIEMIKEHFYREYVVEENNCGVLLDSLLHFLFLCLMPTLKKLKKGFRQSNRREQSSNQRQQSYSPVSS